VLFRGIVRLFKGFNLSFTLDRGLACVQAPSVIDLTTVSFPRRCDRLDNV
jgi:hypothetical protein